MKMKFIKLLTILSFFATTAVQAADTGGAIYEILPCNSEGVPSQESGYTKDNPMVAGETAYFILRLVRTTPMKAAGARWKWKYVGGETEIEKAIDQLAMPLSLGIYVSDRIDFAKFVRQIDYASTIDVTDFLFSYQTKPGDFALPIRLALKNDSNEYKPAGYTEESGWDYVVINRDKFDIVWDKPEPEDDIPAILRFGTVGYPVVRPSSWSPQKDYSLMMAKFYIRTLDFDPMWESVDTFWRGVHSGSTQTESLLPRIVADVAPTNAVKMYIWSEDDNIVSIKGGVNREIVTHYIAGVEQRKTVKMGTITFAMGKPSVDFSIEGGSNPASVGQTTRLILCNLPGYTFKGIGTNERDEDAYLSVPVKCTEPLPPTLVIESDKSTVAASGDFYTPVAQLSIYVTQPYDAPIEVTITPSFEDGHDSGEMEKYIRLSSSDNISTWPPAIFPHTVTIPANSTGKVPLYLYAMRSDLHTRNLGHQIVFTPSVSDSGAASFITESRACGILIDAEAPEILTPAEGASIVATCNAEYELVVSLSDIYADAIDDTIGYEVYFQADSASSMKKLDGTYVIIDNELRLKTDTSKKPVVQWNRPGDQVAQIKVKAPISGKESEVRSFQAQVSQPRKVFLELTDKKDPEGVYNEGDAVNILIKLNEDNDTGTDLYAFLEPGANARPGMFLQSGSERFIIDPNSTASNKGATRGLRIRTNTGSETSPVQKRFIMQDGESEKLGGLSLTFSVVLCDTPEYNEAHIIESYSSNEQTIQVNNVAPVVANVDFKGYSISDFPDHVFPYAVANSQNIEITPIIEDVTYDFSNEERNMQYRWSANCNGVAFDPQIVTAAPGATEEMPPFTFNFPMPGVWTIKIEARDKDMGSNWTKPAYTFSVRALDKPMAYAKPAEAGFLEETNGTARVVVGLDWYDMTMNGQNKFIATKVTIQPPAGAPETAGFMKLDSKYKKGRAPYPDLPEDNNEYYLFFSAQGEQEMAVTAMDGTRASENTGIAVNIEVIGDNTGPDGVHPTALDEGGNPIKWKDYYGSSPANISVRNMMPECNMQTPNTNAWKVSGGLATTRPLRVGVRNDVDADLVGSAECPGIRVRIQGCASGQWSDITLANPLERYITVKDSYTFIPNFGNEQGEKTITITLEDKDGAFEQWEYLYVISPSKFLTTIANGPGGKGDILSGRYSQASGRGQGHTWSTGTPESMFSDYSLKWNCGEAVSVEVYAWGYKVGALDDGSLNDGRDIALSPTGGPSAGPAYYEYDDPERDSFLYAWLRYGLDETKQRGELIAISPESTSGGARSTTLVLPESKQKDESGPYAETFAEAIFAKEWRALDNVGDINQDGIPDNFLIKYDLGILDLTTGELKGNDLEDISTFNGDGDYLPAKSTAGLSIIPHMVGEWPTHGEEFNAFLEIRGFGAGLNLGYKNPDGSNPAPDYTPNEMRAYLLWKGLKTADELVELPDEEVEAFFNDPANLAQATDDLAKANSGTANANNGDPANGWSPERPTDPTKADTDNDGLPDGYEYWFWYAAKVGFSDEKNNKLWCPPVDVGYRLNLDDLRTFDPIPSAEICAAFDPIVNSKSGSNAATGSTLLDRDFDNDGLYDIEEFLMGTNPIHCDTDGDGVPDGYEVMWGLNPLDSEKEGSNPDGDAMAYAHVTIDGESVTLYQVIDVENGKDCLYLVDKTAVEIPGTFVGSRIASKPSDDGLTFVLKFEDAEDFDPGTEYSVVFELNGDSIPKECLPKKRLSMDNFVTELTGEGLAIDLIHDQVFAYFGFNPLTGWATPCEHAKVARWCANCTKDNPQVAEMAPAVGTVVNTRPFTTKDEYLLAEYFRLKGSFTTKDTVLETLLANCTNPNVAYEEIQYGEATTLGGKTPEDNDGAPIFANAQHGADTDGDGVADGWTLYCDGNPIAGSFGGAGGDPLNGGDDRLTNAAEFNGLDVIAAYKDCGSIVSNNIESAWLNKFWPTDPTNGDTDGDGISDDEEGSSWVSSFVAGREAWDRAFFTFLYTSRTLADDDGETVCFRGGGTNPCSIDTDFDGLPDAWERQFAGIVATKEGDVALAATYVKEQDLTDIAERENLSVDDMKKYNNQSMYTEAMKIADAVGLTYKIEGEVYTYAPTDFYIFGGMDATDGMDAVTTGESDEYMGISRDYDFDHDGLENYQEYLTQSVRAWRYDDVETPLMGYGLVWTDGSFLPTMTERVADAPKMDILSGSEYFNTLKTSALWPTISAGNDYYAHLDEYPYGFNYEKMGYMAPIKNTWDPAYQMSAMKGFSYGASDGDGYRYMRPPATMIMYDSTLVSDTNVDSTDRMPALGFVSTDPRMWDTDDDGMDDYWETFHGLNPLLGSRDIIAEAYAYGISNELNSWMDAAGADPGYDAIKTPWRMGLPDVDVDGDGLRNYDESILGNMTSPANYHTDPSPLWMTDSSSPLSYVSQFYDMKQGDNDYFVDLWLYPWNRVFDREIGSIEGARLGYLFSFEETEGYDTDGDWSIDGHEVVHNILPMSDPLNSLDPNRRAALYLSGDNSLAYSAIPSRIPSILEYGAYDLFRQFTVECWIKPEELRKQTILERGFTYSASNLINNQPQWRANFRLEMDESGCVCGIFDNDNAVASGVDTISSQIVKTTQPLVANKWTHLAMTFDGHNFTLYINGTRRQSVASRLIPANGIYAIRQDPLADVEQNETIDAILPYPMLQYRTLDGANVIGARRVSSVFAKNGGFEQFDDYFKGYVSEVRFWDGARSDTEIRENYRTQMTQEQIANNREDVFNAWYYDGATRNDTDGRPMLPAQLISLYTFQTLPAAVNAADVAHVPSGFAKNLRACVNDDVADDELSIQWLADYPTLKSSVYTDTHVVPWIQNHVSNLPMLDGSFSDSQFWSETLAGSYVHAGLEYGTEDFAIPNGGNPYKNRSYQAEPDLHDWRMTRLSIAKPELAETMTNQIWRHRFELSREFVGLDALLPFGDAFAKLSEDYWDEQGATTAWTTTGEDTDGDGLPDWWEPLYGGSLLPNTVVTRDGIEMSAAEAYLRDVAAGMQPDGTPNPTYKDIADMDHDGLVDWWQHLYDIESGAFGDDDGDGLSNYVEYLLTEVFAIGTFDPDNAFSMNANLSDYFYKVGESYVGEIFTDHDFIDDQWEDMFSNDYTTRYLYDASGFNMTNEGIDAYHDADHDGWSNFAEFQAGTKPSELASHGLGGAQMKEYPVPVIEATLIYEGRQATVGAPLVVKAWREATLTTPADAKWTIGGSAQETTGAGAGDASADDAIGTVSKVKLVGINPGTRVKYHLTPGNLIANEVHLEFHDPNRNERNNDTGGIVVSHDQKWHDFVRDRQIGTSSVGEMVNYTGEVIGTIDYKTGVVELDFSKLPEKGFVVSAGPGADAGAAGTAGWTAIYTYADCYLRFNWNSKPTVAGTYTTYYLSDADERTAANNSFDHVKEGRNTFVAFYDLDGNGQYTPGEPYGVVPDVDVSWSGAKFTLAMTDTSVVTARFDVSGANAGDGAAAAEGEENESGVSGELPNDRRVVNNASSNESFADIKTELPVGNETRVRVVRTHVNGVKLNGNGLKSRIVLDRIVDLVNEPFITEADFLNTKRFDIDWDNLASDIKTAGKQISNANVTSVTYRVLIGNDPNLYAITNHWLPISYTRKFDSYSAYKTSALPAPLNSGVEVVSAAPTFAWTIPYGLDTYPAFQIQVKAEGASDNDLMWESDFRHMPPRLRDNNTGTNSTWRYEWKAPIFADSILPNGKIFANNAKYVWRVKLANALYKNENFWSAWTPFRMNVLTNAIDLATVKVAVRYYGPSAVVPSDAVIRVQAFKTADFSGTPITEGYVKDLSEIQSTTAVTQGNVTLIGLEKGTYYIRAFIDTQKDGVRAPWESWGFACERDVKNCDLYKPTPIQIGPSVGSSDIVNVYIEDCDIDADNLPDSWEWVTRGNLTALNADGLDKELSGAVAVRDEITSGLTNPAAATLTSGLAAHVMRLRSSPKFAAVVLGVDISNAQDDEEIRACVNQSVENGQSVEAKTIRVTDIKIDSDGRIILAVETEVESECTSVSPSAQALYEFRAADSVTVDMEVWKTTNLKQNEWQLVDTIENVVLGASGSFENQITPNVHVNDSEKGFFKVILKEKK